MMNCNIFKQYFKTLLCAPTTYIVLLILLAYSFIGILFPATLFPSMPADTPDMTDLNYSAFFSYFSVSFFVSPCFFIFIQHNRNYFNKSLVVHRFRTYQTYWISRMIISFIECFLFLFYIILLLFIRQIFLNSSALFEIISIYIPLMGLHLLGLYFLLLLYSFCSSLFDNSICGLGVCSVFIIYDFITTYRGYYDKVSFFGQSMYSYFNNNSEMTFCYIYITIIIIIICILAYNLLSAKEYRD